MLKIILIICVLVEFRAFGLPISESQLKTQQGRYHSSKVKSFVKDSYSSNDLKKLNSLLKSATEIKVHQNGLVQASDRPLNSLDDPTHYDAVWVRDTLWAYLGLRAQNKNGDAKKVILKILDYFSSSDQIKRASKIIEDPTILNGPDGAMQALHIRFDGASAGFEDVMVGGQPQKWNHKQNDALGLFFDLTLRAVEEGFLSTHDLNDNHYKILALLPAYFSQIKYYEMEDAGSWEEIEKVATSSVGLVTSSLETLAKLLMNEKNNDFSVKLRKVAEENKLSKYLEKDQIKNLIDQGYTCIEKQLAAGGESPLYSKTDKRFRRADSALLNLIYPARLTRLSSIQKLKVLNIISPLVGEVGIRRYLEDSYQSGNFWFQASANTDDTSSSEDFANRDKKFIPHSEAQWFFDSWFSKCAGLLFSETKDKSLKKLQIQHFNRSLGQITGGTSVKKFIGADGHDVAPFSLPESYNVIVLNKKTYFAPSPITPLNWAKASVSIALQELQKKDSK